MTAATSRVGDPSPVPREEKVRQQKWACRQFDTDGQSGEICGSGIAELDMYAVGHIRQRFVNGILVIPNFQTGHPELARNQFSQQTDTNRPHSQRKTPPLHTREAHIRLHTPYHPTTKHTHSEDCEKKHFTAT